MWGSPCAKAHNAITRVSFGLVGLILLGVFLWYGQRLGSPPAHAAVGTLTIDQSVAGSFTALDVTAQRFVDSADASYFLYPYTSGISLATAGTASVSGNLTVGHPGISLYGTAIRAAFGPLLLQYKSDLDAWTTGLTLQDTTGNVGIGTTVPAQKLHISAGNIRLDDTSPAFSSIALQIGGPRTSPTAGNLVFGDGTGWKFFIAKGSDDAATKFVTFQDDGKVGIGTTAPGQALDVVGTVRIENLATSTSTWDIFTVNGTAAGLCDTGSGTSGDALCFRSSIDGAGASAMRLNSAGALAIAGLATTSGNPDIAEQIEVDDPTIVPGDVLVATIPLPEDGRDIYKRSQATKSHHAYERAVIGVVSSDPGWLIAVKNAMSLSDANRSVDGTRRSLSIAGRMPVNIAADSDAIVPGDYLTSSDTPGKAMKATRLGPVIGKALEPWTPHSGKTSTLMFLTVSWYDPNDTTALAKAIEQDQNQITQLKADSTPIKQNISDYDEVKARLSKVEMTVSERLSR